MSQPVKGLVAVLQKMSAWVDEIPPVHQSLRYGNPAFRCERDQPCIMRTPQERLPRCARNSSFIAARSCAQVLQGAACCIRGAENHACSHHTKAGSQLILAIFQGVVCKGG